MMKPVIFAIAVCCAVSCSTAAATPTPAVGSNDAPMDRFGHDMLVRFHMHENFSLVRAIERLLLRGKLAEARDLARAIAIAPDEPGMSTWSKQTIRVRDRASELATATTLDAAFVAESKLAIECAGCHVATGVTPEFATPSQPPPDQATIAARMARHLWAADRLWEGMIGMADDSWRAGLEILAQPPLPAVEMGEVRARFARQLQRVAETARKSTSTDKDRAATYAQLLTQCAACHTSP
jgi:mono/diheme cytochrome c family protein